MNGDIAFAVVGLDVVIITHAEQKSIFKNYSLYQLFVSIVP